MDLWWERSDGSIGRIQFDAWIRSDHESTGELTDRAVERGADIADHYRPGLDRITVEAEVTNTPTVVPETQMDGVEGGVESVDLDVPGIITMRQGAQGEQPAEWERTGQQVGAQVLRFSRPFDRVRRVYDELHRLSREGTVVNVVTKLREYEDMVILQLSAPEEARDAVTFSFEARQVLFAESETVEAPLPWRRRDRGVQPVDPETDETRQRRGSTAYRLIYGSGGS